MRIVVTGATGLLGTAVLRAATARGLEVVAIRHSERSPDRGEVAHEVDLTHPDAASRVLQHEPQWILNCAALTNVDWCESHPGETFDMNAGVPGRLARAAHRAGIQLLHVSTDAVFDGERGGYRESDAVHPINVYAAAKLEGERQVLDLPGHLVMRTTIFGWNTSSARRSLAEWILGRLLADLDVPGFSDAFFTPLLTDDLAESMLDAIGTGLTGLYHAGSTDVTSKYDFARSVAEAFEFDPDTVTAVPMGSVAFAAPRPRNTTLDSTRLETALGRPQPTVRAGIDRFHLLGGGGFYEKLRRMEE